MKSVVAVVLCMVVGSAYGQGLPPAPSGYHWEGNLLRWDGGPSRIEPLRKAAEPVVEKGPIPDKLKEVYGQLDKDVKAADALVKHLKEAASLKPADMEREVNSAAVALSRIADLMGPEGELTAQADAVRSAALVHKKRVETEKGLEEADRSAILTAWDKIIAQTDAARGAMAEISVKVRAALQKLRLRQSAISEYVLVGQYQAAINALTAWLADVQKTIDSLHQTVDSVIPKTV